MCCIQYTSKNFGKRREESDRRRVAHKSASRKMLRIRPPNISFYFIIFLLNIKIEASVTRSSFVSTQNRRPRDPYSNPHENEAVHFLIAHRNFKGDII